MRVEHRDAERHFPTAHSPYTAAMIPITDRFPTERDYCGQLIGQFAVSFWLKPEQIVRVVRIQSV